MTVSAVAGFAVTFGDHRVVDRVAALIASLPRLRFDGSMMKRHDDSQLRGRLVTRATSTVCTAGRGKVHEARIAVDVSCAGPHTSSSRFNGSVMKRHDDSQRSGRWPVMFGDGGDVRVVDRVVAPTLACLAWGDGCR